MGRDRLCARGEGRLRAGPQERREPHRARGGDAARAVRWRADAHPARRAVGLPPQGRADGGRAGPAHRIPDIAVQGRRRRTERRARLHARDRQGRTGERRLRRGEPVHRRSDGRSGERIRAQGHAAQSDRGGRDHPGAAPAPVRAHRRIEHRARGGRVPRALGGTPRVARSRRGAARERRDVPGELSAAPGGAGDAHRQDGDARQLPARAGHAAAARAHHRAPVGGEAGGRDRHPRAPHRPRTRADPPGDRHAASAERLRAGNRQRHRGRRRGEEGARAADRRRAPRGAPAARHLRRPDRLHPHSGVQRAAQGLDGRRAALLDARSRHRDQLHRRGAQALHRRIRVPRRPARCTDALPRRGEPRPGDAPGRAPRRRGRRPGVAQGSDHGDLRAAGVRAGHLRGRSVRRRRRCRGRSTRSWSSCRTTR